MFSSVIIYEATPDDLDAIVELEQNCFKNPWDRQSLEHELRMLSWSRTFIASMHEAPVGYITFWTVADEYQILKVGVQEQYRRHKIGYQMIEHLKALAQSERVVNISLELRVGNTGAKQLYSNCGFSIAGIRRGYYTDTGEDAILMDYLLSR